LQYAGKVGKGRRGEGFQGGKGPGDYLAKRLLKATSEPAEKGSDLTVPPLKFIKNFLINL